MSDACSRHLRRVQDHINRLEERSEGLRAALADVAAALGYGDGEAPRPEELADRVSELRDVVERQAATLRRKCGTTHWYPTEGELSPEMRARLMPEGMEWPRFEDGGLVEMGDEVASRDDDGSPKTMRVGIVRISGGSVRLYDNNGFRITGEGSDGPLRRPAPADADSSVAEDSWERLEKDIREVEPTGVCGYFGTEVCSESCPAYAVPDGCMVAALKDVMRRTKAITEGVTRTNEAREDCGRVHM